MRALTVASVVEYVCNMCRAVFKKIGSHENCLAMHLAYFRKCGEVPAYILPQKHVHEM